MTVKELIVVLGLFSVLFFVYAIRNLRRYRIAVSLLQGMVTLLLACVAAGAFVVTMNLRGYQPLTADQPAGQLQLTKVGYHQFNGTIIFPSGERGDFALRGDEWQIDARLIRWKGLAKLLGADSVYRLQQISGRYTNPEEQRTLLRTAATVNATDRLDLWALAHEYQAWLPGLESLAATAPFLPMTDGAEYEITVSPAGLSARPAKQSARGVMGNWQ